MSTKYSREHVFRFIAARPANLKHRAPQRKRKFSIYTDQHETKLYKNIREAVTMNRAKEIAKGFSEYASYVTNLGELEFDVLKLYDWMSENGDKKIADLSFKEEIEKLYQQQIDEILESEAYRRSYEQLADTLLTISLLGGEAEPESARGRDDIVIAIKLLKLIELVNGQELFLENDDKVGAYISESSLLLPDLTLKPEESQEEKETEDLSSEFQRRREEEEKHRLELQNKLKEFTIAHRELARLATDDAYRRMPREEEPAPEREVTTPGARPILRDEDPPEITDPASSRFLLSARAYEALSQESKNIIRDFNLDPNEIHPANVVTRLEEEIRHFSGQLGSEFHADKVIKLGGIHLDVNKFKDSIGIVGNIWKGIFSFKAKCKFAAGIGDLLLVKQDLKAYELADFAHVENVLAGEKREREHRRLDVREEITTIEEETETETERDLQSTERNEMQKEAEKTVKDEFKLDAGLQVSGSYGPSVSFSSSLNAGFSTSTEETQKKASSYSREVTQKTSERIQERVREERKRRVLQEIEEINKHSINNENAEHGHVRGIYRWLNKVYDAQVLNYGQRMLYEFIIPEPAAFFLYALVDNPPQDMELVKPQEPTFNGKPLKPGNLDRNNYHEYVAKYQVVGAPEPPSQFTVLSHFEKLDGQQGSEEEALPHSGRGTILKVPDGYEAYGAMESVSFVKSDGGSIVIMVGGVYKKYTKGGVTYANFNTRFRGEISVSIRTRRFKCFTVGVDIFCTLTAEGFAKWQHSMYEAILHAYLQQKAEYEEKIAAEAIQKGIQILGRNPLENRRLEQQEIKKLIIMMLRGWPFMNFDSFFNLDEPVMYIHKACKFSSIIRFFENAFEWNNLLYVFYPYFWGRKAKWISALHFTDPDPDFAAFLKAGAARVQVPVRPGFERAIVHFCQYGEIWEGNDAPLKNDDLYVPIIDEITENLGKLDNGVPYPEGSEPWEVIIPTSLIVVQDLNEIPGIRDTLSGNDMKLAES